MLFGLLTESIYALFVDLHEVVLNTDRCNAFFFGLVLHISRRMFRTPMRLKDTVG